MIPKVIWVPPFWEMERFFSIESSTPSEKQDSLTFSLPLTTKHPVCFSMRSLSMFSIFSRLSVFCFQCNISISYSQLSAVLSLSTKCNILVCLLMLLCPEICAWCWYYVDMSSVTVNPSESVVHVLLKKIINSFGLMWSITVVCIIHQLQDKNSSSFEKGDS